MSSYRENTLRYDPSLCTACGLCSIVCPHRVFEPGEPVARLARAESCIECGACSRNCAPGAIEVESGVGCASALLGAALLGREAPCCGPRDERDRAATGCCAGEATGSVCGGESNGEGRCS